MDIIKDFFMSVLGSILDSILAGIFSANGLKVLVVLIIMAIIAWWYNHRR